MKTKITLLFIILFFDISSYGQMEIVVKSLTGHESVQTNMKYSTIDEIDTVFSFNTPGNIPFGICSDGNNLWHCDTSQYIYKLSANGEVIDTIPHPDEYSAFRGGGMTFDGANIWIVNSQTAKLFQIDVNGNILKKFDLPSVNTTDPYGFGIAWDGSYLWHSQHHPWIIYKIDPANGNYIDYLVPQVKIRGIEWINNKLYGIADIDNIYRLVQIDTRTGQCVDTIDWPVRYPFDLCWDNSFLWNVSGPNEVIDIQLGGLMKIYKIQMSLATYSPEHRSSLEKLEVYPNPFSSCLTIVSNKKALIDISITDSHGRVLRTFCLDSQKKEIDLSFLSSGMYFINQGDKVIKVLKVK